MQAKHVILLLHIKSIATTRKLYYEAPRVGATLFVTKVSKQLLSSWSIINIWDVFLHFFFSLQF